MSTIEETESALKLYEANLEQVQSNLVLADDSLKDDLLQVESDLKQLIDLTKQNLLEEKKKALLAQLMSFDDDEKEEEIPVAESQTILETISEEDSSTHVDFSCLEGVKCQAPHGSGLYGNESSYHNAIVFACEKESNNFDEISVRVVFSNPSQLSMLPCPFYLNGNCRYTDETCKFSHGEVVPLACLREFEEPNFSSLQPGHSVMAKDEANQLWQHATVVEVDPKGIYIDVRFSSKGSIVHRMNLESVLPLKKSSDCDDDDNEMSLDIDMLEKSSKEDDDFAPISITGLMPDGNAGPLGSWEQFTRGIGSKLMMSMGYIMGSGLGKNAEGRIEPVEAMLYPQGRSLDFCMTLREKSQGGNTLTVEKTLIKQQKQAEKIAERRLQSSKSSSVFDFINTTLGGKKGKPSSIQTKGGPDLSLRKKDGGSSNKTTKDPPNLKLQGFHVSENIMRAEREVRALSESFNRVNRMDPKSAAHIKTKLAAAQSKLRALQNTAANIDNKQKSKSEMDKLTRF